MLKPKVLVVNDHSASLLALQSILTGADQKEEYEVLTALSGEEALRLILQHNFAVVLLDVNMPVMDGFETAEIIHSHPRTATTPIIFVTAHFADEMHKLKGYQKGAVDYLFTPVIPQILQNKVSVFVDLAKKNLQLEHKTYELAELNRDLRVQQMQDLRRVNATLEAEIIERRQAEERAHGLATRDALTDLLNRRSLMEHLEHAISRAGRQGKGLAVLFLDLDKFKTINDTLGHDVGDGLLIKVANRITECVRDSDVVARLGGDEFVILMEGLNAYTDAAELSRKIVDANAPPFQISGHTVQTSASIGISFYPQDGEDVQTLMKNADLAMYHAKQQQRGSVQFFHEELNVRLQEKIRLERELQSALTNQEFELHYQAKVDITSGRVTGVEALLRWHHPELGLISGADFIDAASESGLLVPIGEWVIQAACAQASIWRDTDSVLRQVPIAINVAIPQIHNELPEIILKALRRHNLPPSCLQLEVTEQLLILDLEKTTSVLKQISETGITIAIDDFGTGYSSLSVLKSLPIDILKIDQSFVRDLGLRIGDNAIVAAIINMARALALRVVAEGVETEEQLAILKSLGCDEYQGFLYGHPQKAEVLMQQMRQVVGA